jgi:putative transposase
MKKRKWTKEEKLEILKEAKSEGLQITLRKHGVYPSTYYSWRKKLKFEGEEGLDAQERRRKDGHYIRKLEDEVSLLKELLADREMQIALKDELLKKKYPWARKNPS